MTGNDNDGNATDQVRHRTDLDPRSLGTTGQGPGLGTPAGFDGASRWCTSGWCGDHSRSYGCSSIVRHADRSRTDVPVTIRAPLRGPPVRHHVGLARHIGRCPRHPSQWTPRPRPASSRRTVRSGPEPRDPPLPRRADPMEVGGRPGSRPRGHDADPMPGWSRSRSATSRSGGSRTAARCTPPARPRDVPRARHRRGRGTRRGPHGEGPTPRPCCPADPVRARTGAGAHVLPLRRVLVGSAPTPRRRGRRPPTTAPPRSTHERPGRSRRGDGHPIRHPVHGHHRRHRRGRGHRDAPAPAPGCGTARGRATLAHPHREGIQAPGESRRPGPTPARESRRPPGRFPPDARDRARRGTPGHRGRGPQPAGQGTTEPRLAVPPLDRRQRVGVVRHDPRAPGRRARVCRGESRPVPPVQHDVLSLWCNESQTAPGRARVHVHDLRTGHRPGRGCCGDPRRGCRTRTGAARARRRGRRRRSKRPSDTVTSECSCVRDDTSRGATRPDPDVANAGSARRGEAWGNPDLRQHGAGAGTCGARTPACCRTGRTQRPSCSRGTAKIFP